MSAGEDVAGREHETVLLEVAAALHVLAFSQSSSNRLDAAHQLVCHSVYLRQRLLPESHPLTLESLLLQAQILIKLDQAHEAVKIMVDASGKMTRVLGPDHVDTLLCMGELADLYRSIGQTQEASLVERKIIEAGSSLLLHTKVLDRVRNVAVVCSLLGESLPPTLPPSRPVSCPTPWSAFWPCCGPLLLPCLDLTLTASSSSF